MSASPPTPARGLITAPRVIAGICLVIPFVAMMWVSSYTRTTPTLIGIPFFYWYQIAWVLGSALLTFIAYTLITREEKSRAVAGTTVEGEQA